MSVHTNTTSLATLLVTLALAAFSACAQRSADFKVMPGLISPSGYAVIHMSASDDRLKPVIGYADDDYYKDDDDDDDEDDMILNRYADDDIEKRRLRFAKRRLRFNKRRLRFQKKSVNTSDKQPFRSTQLSQQLFPGSSMHSHRHKNEGGLTSLNSLRKLQHTDMLLHSRRKRSSPASLSTPEGSAHAHTTAKRSASFPTLGGSAHTTAKRISINQDLKAIADYEIAKLKLERAKELNALRSKLIALGKRGSGVSYDVGDVGSSSDDVSEVSEMAGVSREPLMTGQLLMALKAVLDQ